MDEVNIVSTFMQGMLMRIIESALKKRLGIDPLLQINDPIKVSFDGDMARVHLNLDAALAKGDLIQLVSGLM